MTIIVYCEQTGLLCPTSQVHGKITCSQCGEVDPKGHEVHVFQGAFCPLHQVIHYRWIHKDWSLFATDLFEKRRLADPHISAVPTESGIEKFFTKKYFWLVNGSNCTAPEFREVLWTGFEEDVDVLRRPSDTGYLKSKPLGIQAPYLSALYEWLLSRSEWDEYKELVQYSQLPKQEKQQINKTITSPTPTNIFKFLWMFRRFIPGWNTNRTLGRRPHSALIIDEIRWSTGRMDGLEKKEIETLEKIGPESEYWGVWEDLWPKTSKLNGAISDFHQEFKYLGISYGQTLELMDGSPGNAGRTWQEVISNMVNWPLVFQKGGMIASEGQNHKAGFINNFSSYLAAASQVKVLSTSSTSPLITSMPLEWVLSSRDPLSFTFQAPDLTKSCLQETLLALTSWIIGKDQTPVKLFVSQSLSQNNRWFLSFEVRLQNTSVEIIEKPE